MALSGPSGPHNGGGCGAAGVRGLWRLIPFRPAAAQFAVGSQVCRATGDGVGVRLPPEPPHAPWAVELIHIEARHLLHVLIQLLGVGLKEGLQRLG